MRMGEEPCVHDAYGRGATMGATISATVDATVSARMDATVSAPMDATVSGHEAGRTEPLRDGAVQFGIVWSGYIDLLQETQKLFQNQRRVHGFAAQQRYDAE